MWSDEMGADQIITWGVAALLLALAAVLLSGKGGFLIAGYNTMSQEKKARYDERKLCRVLGAALLVIAFILMVDGYFGFEPPEHLTWLVPWGVFAPILISLILANTVCRKK